VNPLLSLAAGLALGEILFGCEDEILSEQILNRNTHRNQKGGSSYFQKANHRLCVTHLGDLPQEIDSLFATTSRKFQTAAEFFKILIPQKDLAPTEEAPQVLASCPEPMAKVDRFCIDRYEAHLLADEKPHPYQERPPEGKSFQAVSEAKSFPQGYMSRDESESACRAASKRLCKLSEWLRACRGPSKTIFPYGNFEKKGSCNTRKPHLLSLKFQDAGPSSWKYSEHFNNPSLNLVPGFLEMTGSYQDCSGEEKIFDMVGNLHEWVSDTVDSNLPSKIVLVPPIARNLRKNFGHGIFMGGFYSTGAQHGVGCNFITIGHEPSYHDYSTGFRCCKDSAEGASETHPGK